MKYNLTVHSVGPGTIVEKVKRANGQEIEARLPALAVELTGSDMLNTISFRISAEDAKSMPASCLAPGAEWSVDISPVEEDK